MIFIWVSFWTPVYCNYITHSVKGEYELLITKEEHQRSELNTWFMKQLLEFTTKTEEASQVIFCSWREECLHNWWTSLWLECQPGVSKGTQEHKTEQGNLINIGSHKFITNAEQNKRRTLRQVSSWTGLSCRTQLKSWSEVKLKEENRRKWAQGCKIPLWSKDVSSSLKSSSCSSGSSRKTCWIIFPGVGRLMKLWMYTFTNVAIRNWQSNLKMIMFTWTIWVFPLPVHNTTMSRYDISKILDLECPLETRSKEATKGADDGGEEGHPEGMEEEGVDGQGLLVDQQTRPSA